MQKPDRYVSGVVPSSVWPYILGIALVLLTLWLRVRFDGAFSGPTLIVFSLPIVLAAYFGGLWPGLLATAASILGANYYLLPPIHSFAVASSQEQWQDVMLAASGILISGICETLHRLRRQAETTRKAAEAGQAASAALAALVASSADAIAGNDLSGRVTNWNPAAERMFGFTAEEVSGMRVARMIPPDRLEEDAEILARIKAGQMVENFETVRLHKDGSKLFVALSASPIRDANGAVIGISKIARDITEKRAAEAHLQALQAEMAHGARLDAMGQMSAAIAHEINQPLSALTNFISAAQMMLETPPLDAPKAARVGDAIDRAAEQALRAGAIIRRLREFVSKREPEKAREDLNRIVEDSAALALLNTTESGVDAHLELTPQPLPVYADRIQLQQVILNLIRNALDAMAEPSLPEHRLTIRTAIVNDCATVDVSDTGPGMSPEILARLFQPFTTSKDKGMGIGLTICQSIMESHGGSIQALQNTKKGATFRIQVPLDLEGEPAD